MLRLSLALAVLVFLSAGDTAHATLSFEPGTKTNVLSVSYSAIPDPLNWFSFFPMPRTLAKAQSDKFALVGMRDDSKTTVWCRDKDYRVCLLFDGQGSVAGLQMALAVKDLQDVKTQFDSIPEWQRQIYLGEDVYIATVFFVSKDVLLGGGRALVDDTPTAPDGIYIQLKNGSLLHASTKQEEALKADFHEQNCHNGMGKHYFQMSKSTACETMRPVFLLFGPQGPLAGKLIGFGFSVFGKPSSTRNWFESSSTSMIKRVVPNSPPCLEKWTKAHGLTTFHVYFVDNAYYIRC